MKYRRAVRWCFRRTAFLKQSDLKRSSEVWEILASVKKEFSNFGTVLEKAQRKIKEADNEIEKMVTTRTRMMLSKLRKVEQIEPATGQQEEEEDSLQLL